MPAERPAFSLWTSPLILDSSAGLPFLMRASTSKGATASKSSSSRASATSRSSSGSFSNSASGSTTPSWVNGGPRSSGSRRASVWRQRCGIRGDSTSQASQLRCDPLRIRSATVWRHGGRASSANASRHPEGRTSLSASAVILSRVRRRRISKYKLVYFEILRRFRGSG